MNKDSKLIAEAYSNEVVSKKPDVDLLKKKKQHFDETVQKLQYLANEVKKVINKEALDVANEIYYQGEEWYNYYSKVEDKQTRQLAKLVFGAENFAGFAQVSDDNN